MQPTLSRCNDEAIQRAMLYKTVLIGMGRTYHGARTCTTLLLLACGLPHLLPLFLTPTQHAIKCSPRHHQVIIKVENITVFFEPMLISSR